MVSGKQYRYWPRLLWAPYRYGIKYFSAEVRDTTGNS
jgi:hypothetical protein